MNLLHKCTEMRGKEERDWRKIMEGTRVSAEFSQRLSWTQTHTQSVRPLLASLQLTSVHWLFGANKHKRSNGQICTHDSSCLNTHWKTFCFFQFCWLAENSTYLNLTGFSQCTIHLKLGWITWIHEMNLYQSDDSAWKLSLKIRLDLWQIVNSKWKHYV